MGGQTASSVRAISKPTPRPGRVKPNADEAVGCLDKMFQSRVKRPSSRGLNIPRKGAAEIRMGYGRVAQACCAAPLCSALRCIAWMEITVSSTQGGREKKRGTENGKGTKKR
jgi:hypothetical protein